MRMSLSGSLLAYHLLTYQDQGTPSLGLVWVLYGVIRIVVAVGGLALFSFAMRRMLRGGKADAAGDLFSPEAFHR